MDEDKAEKAALYFVGVIIGIIIATVCVGVWGFIELIQWITTK